jgi:hypothetical protein
MTSMASGTSGSPFVGWAKFERFRIGSRTFMIEQNESVTRTMAAPSHD